MDPGAQTAGREPMQARRWELQEVFLAHSATALALPGINDGEGAEEMVGNTVLEDDTLLTADADKIALKVAEGEVTEVPLRVIVGDGESVGEV